MVSPNIPLKRRAGGNVGVTPIGAGLAAYQQTTNAPYILLTDTDTVLWEGQANAARVPGGTASQFPAMLLGNDTASGDTVDVTIFFVDALGNELDIGAGSLVLASGSGLIILNGNQIKGWGAPFCLEEGEQIIARVTGTAPAGRVQVVAFSKDFKVKGQGKGGLSDGGVICIHGEPDSEGNFEFGPPPGQTWEGIFTDAVLNQQSSPSNEPYLGSGHGIGLYIANHDPLDYTFFMDLIDPDGNALEASAGEGPYTGHAGEVTLLNVSDAVDPDFSALALIMFPLQYPAKLRIRHDTSTPLPAGPVQIRLMMAASDVASDLTQGE